MNAQISPSILTHSGTYVDLVHPDPADICIRDIAWALSHTARFNGHTKEFYSVAQHCVLCCWNAPADQRWAALMHDASEAYLGDVVSPLKQLLPEYKRMEKIFQSLIAKKYNFTYSNTVKSIDLRALATERRDLMPETQAHWPILNDVVPWNSTIDVWSPIAARVAFMSAASIHNPAWKNMPQAESKEELAI